MTGATDRLFLAVPLTHEVRAALAEHLARAFPQGVPGRAVVPEHWHLTLRFLGDTPPPAAEAVRREVGAATLGPPLSIGFGGFGAFPRASRASVLWLGVAEGEPALRQLAERVETAARRAGFPPERRPFAAHLTLSRLRAPEDVRALIERAPPFDQRLPVTEVVLYRSHLGRGPARYEVVERFGL